MREVMATLGVLGRKTTSNNTLEVSIKLEEKDILFRICIQCNVPGL